MKNLNIRATLLTAFTVILLCTTLIVIALTVPLRDTPGLTARGEQARSTMAMQEASNQLALTSNVDKVLLSSNLAAAVKAKDGFTTALAEATTVAAAAGDKVIEVEQLNETMRTTSTAVGTARDKAGVETQTAALAKQVQVTQDALTLWEEQQAVLAAQLAAQQAAAAKIPAPAPVNKVDAGAQAPLASGPAPTNQEALMAKYRSILTAVGGGNVILKWRDGETASSAADGVIYIGENIWGEPYWAMRHELAHQFIFNVAGGWAAGGYNALLSNQRFLAAYGGNREILANCMATQMGSYTGDDCSGDRGPVAAAVLAGRLP